MSGKLVLNSAGIQEVLTSPAVDAAVGALAHEVVAAAQPGDYVARRSPSTHRARWTVFAATAKEEFENGYDNILVKALGRVKR